MMYLKLHGGGCCGMSHIYGFPYTPNTVLTSITATAPSPEAQAIRVRTFPGVVFINRPAEPAKERFRALIIQRESHRWSGIIEVVLVGLICDNWRPTLEEFGFKEVNTHLNSNTNNILHVFHRNSGSVPKLTEPKKEKKAKEKV